MTALQDVLDDIQADVLSYLANNAGNANVGTDDTPASTSDTSLGAQVFEDTIDDTDTTQTDRVTFTLQIGVGEANGNTLQEAGFEKSDGTQWFRDIINDLAKTSDIQAFLDFRVITAVVEDTSL